MTRLLQLALLKLAAALWFVALRIDARAGGAKARAARAFDDAARKVIAAGASEHAPQPSSRDVERPEPPEGYVHMTPRGRLDAAVASSLLLVDDSRHVFVPVFVGPTEALAFQNRLERRSFSRPLIYDLTERLLLELGATIGSVRIDELRDQVFIATVVLLMPEGRVLELDARASDAIVLALGSRAPIVVAEDVVRVAGRTLDALVTADAG
jgi:bifunctional DNase/RNase